MITTGYLSHDIALAFYNLRDNIAMFSSFKLANICTCFYSDSAIVKIKSLEANPNGPAHEILVLTAYASSQGSDEPAEMRSLVRAFAACTHKYGH